MTIPHLMNCPHMDDGWCLDCVRQMYDENEAARALVEWLEIEKEVTRTIEGRCSFDCEELSQRLAACRKGGE